MKKILVLFFLYQMGWGQLTVNGQTLKTGPVTNLEVIVNGEKFQISDGDTLNISGTEIIVRTSDHKSFDFGILSFLYPGYFTFSHEQDGDYQNWTLSGNDFLIMYFEFGSEVELDMFAAEMVKQFGARNCKLSEKQTRIGNFNLSGKRIDIDLIDQKFTYDLFKLASDDLKSHFIAFQDSKTDDGSDSAESIETMNILDRSFIKK